MTSEGTKKIYFASDTHFGAKCLTDPMESERRFVRWLNTIQPTAKAVYLLGDMIDFWFEYRTAVPRGFVRFFGKIAEMTDAGVEVHWFTGNHDLWVTDYLPTELGVIVHRRPLLTTLEGRTFLMAHGDEYGDPKDYKYRFIRTLFHSSLCQRLLAMVHPRWTIGVAHSWSSSSRAKGERYHHYLGEEKEHLVRFAKSYLQNHAVDLFVFGHRHIPLDLLLPNNSRVVILGDWITNNTYGVLDKTGFSLEIFE